MRFSSFYLHSIKMQHYEKFRRLSFVVTWEMLRKYLVDILSMGLNLNLWLLTFFRYDMCLNEIFWFVEEIFMQFWFMSMNLVEACVGRKWGLIKLREIWCQNQYFNDVYVNFVLLCCTNSVAIVKSEFSESDNHLAPIC